MNNAPPVPEIAACLERLAADPFAPSSTYRLQFHHEFTFADARRRVKYLAELGVGAVYASPILKAEPGSMHGYDIIDHGEVNPELGGEPGLRQFARELRRCALGLLLDVVPNHMSVGGGNRWWLDVLENGRASPYAGFFDIDWRPPRAEMADTVLLPILGDQFGRVLDRGELRLAFAGGAFSIHYYDHILPLAPATYADALQPALESAAAALPAQDDALLELQSVITAARNLPATTETDTERITQGRREVLVIRRRLQELTARSPAVRSAIEAAVAALNGRPNDSASHDALAELLSRQPYRLSHWRVATDEINYRRFFDVNGLAALCMERPEVFATTHALVLRLLAQGMVQGLRIDHIDGLLDPAAYLWRLQASSVLARCTDAQMHATPARADASDTPDAAAEAEPQLVEHLRGSRGAAVRPLYIVVEKILGHGERLPVEWPVDGTTGYDFLNAVNGIFVDGSQRRAFDALYAAFTGERLRYRELVYEAKKQIMRNVLASEVNVLALQLSRIAAANRWYRDFSLTALTAALVEAIACFPIYRTYVRADADTAGNVAIAERDLLYIDLALTRARRLNPLVDPSIFAFIQATLTLSGGVSGPGDPRLDFALKFQQVTGPVMAKGIEDTAFYRYNRLISLNEVGGDPDQFGSSIAAFHRQNSERQARFPRALLASSTHDTKRSEDVRARLNVLSELPDEWRRALRQWSRLNRRHGRSMHGERYPDRNDEYHLYQAVAGAWPLELLEADDRPGFAAFAERLQAYMLKAVREAKLHTSWITQNASYEDALQAFVAALFAEPEHNPFVQAARPFVRRLAAFGMVNSLAQTLLKLTCPGVPDLYQGTELWDFSLVDPDNRRPVDYERRSAALCELQRRTVQARGDTAALAADLWAAKADGRIKLLVTHDALALRQRWPALFGAEAGYTALEAAGERAEHVIAFARRQGDAEIVVAVPRFPARLERAGTRPGETAPSPADLWGGTRLLLAGVGAGTTYRDVFTGATVQAQAAAGATGLPLQQVFATLPVALLERVALFPPSPFPQY